MILIDDIIISDDVVEKHFVCDLARCKGGCCVEGDAGAPLEVDELALLDEHYDSIEPFLQPKGIQSINERGKYVFEKDDEYTGYGTPLIGNTGACAYVTKDENGIAVCGIEKAFEADAIPFQKPVSCHLYPVRVKVFETMTAVNFDTWDICSPACKLGDQLKVPAYQFVKQGLIRKFGEDFYQQLEGAAKYKQEND